MKNVLLYKFSLVICFCLLFFVQQTQGQQKSCDNKVEYEDVINYLFPQDYVGLGNGYSLILKYNPPWESEIQINIFHIQPKKFEVTLYKHKSKRDNDSVRLQLEEIQEKNCNTSFSDIIQQIKIEKIQINLTEEDVLKIRAEFFDAVKKSNDLESRKLERMNSNLARITLDSPSYEVIYNGIGRISLYGESNYIDGKPLEDEPPFIEWMRGVYKIIKAKRKS